MDKLLLRNSERRESKCSPGLNGDSLPHRACKCAQLLSHVRLFEILWTEAHGILQASLLELVALSSFTGPSQPGDRTLVFCFAGGFLTTEPPWKPLTSASVLTSSFMGWGGSGGCVCVCVRVHARLLMDFWRTEKQLNIKMHTSSLPPLPFLLKPPFPH